jgi:hypothetical protein
MNICFCDIIRDRKHVFYSYFINSHVEFIRRQINEVAHKFEGKIGILGDKKNMRGEEKNSSPITWCGPN